MAKSIYETLTDLTTETSVPEIKDKDGKVLRPNMGSISHTLPREHYPEPNIFDDEEKFLSWARKNKSLLSLLQNGISSWLISDRALFKSMPSKESKKEWSPEFGQAQVDGREWKVAKRPKGGSSKAVGQARSEDCMQMIVNLTSSGMDKDGIKNIVLPIYGEELVNELFEAVESMK